MNESVNAASAILEAEDRTDIDVELIHQAAAEADNTAARANQSLHFGMHDDWKPLNLKAKPPTSGREYLGASANPEAEAMLSVRGSGHPGGAETKSNERPNHLVIFERELVGKISQEVVHCDRRPKKADAERVDHNGSFFEPQIAFLPKPTKAYVSTAITIIKVSGVVEMIAGRHTVTDGVSQTRRALSRLTFILNLDSAPPPRADEGSDFILLGARRRNVDE
jgi:hypothetical protein